MKRRDVRIGEVYGYRVSQHDRWRKVRVTGAYVDGPRGRGFPTNAEAETTGYVPPLSKPRWLTPWTDCEAKILAAKEQHAAKVAAQETSRARWRTAPEIFSAALGQRKGGNVFFAVDGSYLKILITDPLLGLLLAEAIQRAGLGMEEEA